jgi:hypothetical protein
LQEQDEDFRLEPGVSTEDQDDVSSTAIPSAPVHTSVLKKTREITHRMRAREPNGAQVLFKPPTKARLAEEEVVVWNLIKPDATVKRVVTMKKSFAEKSQCDLALTNTESVYYRDLARWKKSPLLNQHSDANKLSTAKFSSLGTIMGMANWVQILNDFVTRTLKEDTPDMAAVFHALELQSKLNVHGVIDGAAKLQGAAIWEKRTELLQVANVPANLLTRLRLKTSGPRPILGSTSCSGKRGHYRAHGVKGPPRHHRHIHTSFSSQMSQG